MSITVLTERIRFAYDDAGRLAKTTDGKGGVVTNGYDAEGRLTARTAARGQKRLTRYDASERVRDTIAADSAVTSLAYCTTLGSAGNAGEPCSVVDALGNVTKRDITDIALRERIG